MAAFPQPSPYRTATGAWKVPPGCRFLITVPASERHHDWLVQYCQHRLRETAFYVPIPCLYRCACQPVDRECRDPDRTQPRRGITGEMLHAETGLSDKTIRSLMAGEFTTYGFVEISSGGLKRRATDTGVGVRLDVQGRPNMVLETIYTCPETSLLRTGTLPPFIPTWQKVEQRLADQRARAQTRKPRRRPESRPWMAHHRGSALTPTESPSGLPPEIYSPTGSEDLPDLLSYAPSLPERAPSPVPVPPLPHNPYPLPDHSAPAPPPPPPAVEEVPPILTITTDPERMRSHSPMPADPLPSSEDWRSLRDFEAFCDEAQTGDLAD